MFGSKEKHHSLENKLSIHLIWVTLQPEGVSDSLHSTWAGVCSPPTHPKCVSHLVARGAAGPFLSPYTTFPTDRLFPPKWVHLSSLLRPRWDTFFVLLWASSLQRRPPHNLRKPEGGSDKNSSLESFLMFDAWIKLQERAVQTKESDQHESFYFQCPVK